MKILSKINKAIYNKLPLTLKRIADYADKSHASERIVDGLSAYVFVAALLIAIVTLMYSLCIPVLIWISWFTYKTFKKRQLTFCSIKQYYKSNRKTRWII
jgi:hypothetical protein